MINEKVIGYSISEDDNDSYFFDAYEKPNTPICPKCGYILDFISYHNPFLKVKRKIYDYSCTYDNRAVVSLRFKEFCIRERYPGLQFKEFERSPGFFQFIVDNVVEFDIEKRKTELFGLCEACGNYKTVAGGYPVFLKNVHEPLIKGFYRTDLCFGSGNTKSPIIVVDVTTHDKLKREKMKGILLKPIEL